MINQKWYRRFNIVAVPLLSAYLILAMLGVAPSSLGVYERNIVFGSILLAIWLIAVDLFYRYASDPKQRGRYSLGKPLWEEDQA